MSKQHHSSHRVKSKHGHNVHASQHTDLPAMKHEWVIIPSSTPINSWGGYGLLDFKEKNCILHDLALMYQVQLPTITAGSNPISNMPDLSPAIFWTTRIEIVHHNNVIDTIYPLAQFIHQQLFNHDEERKVKNVAMGDYANIVQRQQLFAQGGTFIVPLWTYFKQAHIPMIVHNHDLQLRLYLDTVQNVYTSNGATLSTGLPVMNSCSLLAKVSRLHGSHAEQIHRSLKAPQHFQFLETRFQQFTMTAQPSPIQTSIPLTSIVGKVSFLYFTVRPVTGTTDDNAWNFTPITSFNILDATGQNITGGQPVPSALALTLLNEDNVLSTYLTENIEGKGVTSTAANVYMYSFSASAHTSARDGLSLNHYQFRGNEQLQIQFAGAIPNVSVDIFAFTEAVLEVAHHGVKKIAL